MTEELYFLILVSLGEQNNKHYSILITIIFFMENKGKTYYWSRAPGKIVDKFTGVETSFSGSSRKVLGQSKTKLQGDPKSTLEVTVTLIKENETQSTLAPRIGFIGTVRQWYETLYDVILDAANDLQKETRVVPTLIVCNQKTLNIMEILADFRNDLESITNNLTPRSIDAGPYKSGILSNKFIVMTDFTMDDELQVIALDPNDKERKLGSRTIKILDSDIL